MRRTGFVCPLLAVLAFAGGAHAGPLAVALEWNAQPRMGQVELFDADPALAQPAYLTRLVVGNYDRFLVPDADHQRVYTGYPGGDFLRSFDTADRNVETIPGIGVDNGPFAVHPDGRRVYVVNRDAREVAVLDRLGGLLARIAIADSLHPTDTPENIVALPDGSAFIVVSYRARLYRIDAATNAVRVIADLNGPTAIEPPMIAAPDSDAVFIGQGAFIVRADVRTGAALWGTVASVYGRVTALAVTADGATLYATSGEIPGFSSAQNRLHRLDAATLYGPSTPVNLFPKSLALRPDARVDGNGRMTVHTLYMTLGSRAEISVMDGLTFTWLPAIATYMEPSAVAFVESPSLARPRSFELGRNAGTLARSEYSNLAFADVTGDGLDDACVRLVAPASGAPGIYCAENLGRRFGGFFQWSASFGADWEASESYWSTIRYPDVNGDGFHDICGRFSDGIRCALSRGRSGFGMSFVWLPDLADGQAVVWSRPQYYQTIQFTDLDADGRDDLCVRAPNGIKCALSAGTSFQGFRDWLPNQFTDTAEWDNDAAYWGTIKLARIDNDTRPDVCGRGVNGVICAINNGTGFGSPVVWDADLRDANGWLNPQYHRTIQLTDIDGDGMADLCARGSGGVYCDRSTGTNFARVGVAGDFSDLAGWNTENHYRSIRVVDVDGDGLADACGRGSRGVRCQRLQRVNGVLQFRAAEWRVTNFGDNYGWGALEELWSTVQPARLDRASGVEYCGRGDGGIVCSDL